MQYSVTAASKGILVTETEEDTSDNAPEKERDSEDSTTGLRSGKDFVEHIILPSDTLIGICLRYKVTKRELQKCNNFFGDNFRLCHKLIIPIKDGASAVKLQQMTPEIKIKLFQNESGLGVEEAKFYLEMADWHVQRALKQCSEDKRWEATQVKPLGSPQATCPSHHTLKNFTITKDYWSCDRCQNMDCPRGSVMYGCRLCNYDICQNCMGPSVGQQQAVMQSQVDPIQSQIGRLPYQVTDEGDIELAPTDRTPLLIN
mmetsp:Transcript_17650/g.23236  ORF Transcript_17650/g.23236 Transcript_17650/m.23236 type:complete len:258 (+) Transcript_17650:72-845(+)